MLKAKQPDFFFDLNFITREFPDGLELEKGKRLESRKLNQSSLKASRLDGLACTLPVEFPCKAGIR